MSRELREGSRLESPVPELQPQRSYAERTVSGSVGAWLRRLRGLSRPRAGTSPGDTVRPSRSVAPSAQAGASVGQRVLADCPGSRGARSDAARGWPSSPCARSWVVEPSKQQRRIRTSVFCSRVLLQSPLCVPVVFSVSLTIWLLGLLLGENYFFRESLPSKYF